MEQMFWIEDNAVGGRSGPDKDPWDIVQLADAGVTAILSVNDGEGVHIARLKECGVDYAHIPLSSNAPPLQGDVSFCLDALPRIVEFIARHRSLGKVIVHCRSGKDRTGIALAAYLMHSQKMSANDAYHQIKAIRDIAFTAPGWEVFSLKVLAAFEQGA
ncbi:dual specificity protein phosphatase family protein [Enterovibrio norvegicus]|uniref:dual specificity protein phosphatase family protein n=1 Tax=Enterovibrio norvegicus TaxID=188144 RepID=UPI000C828808|nr:dual specificity protein phosphatase family protein [Enterovibrio norvegicus]PML79983.1 phosphatase [Enterovibrio norvegicus]